MPVSLGYLFGFCAWIIVLVACFVLLLRRRRTLRGQTKRLRWVHLGLSAWMALLLLTGCEAFFAFFVDHSDAFNMTNVSKRWFEQHIDRERNDFGNRDVEPFLRNTPDGTHRICFIGDSFTVGHGIENIADRFTDRVAAGLNRKFPGKYLVANLGSPGLEIAQIEGKLRDVLKKEYDVGTFVYVICLNDIEYYDKRTEQNLAQLRDAQPHTFLFTKTYFLNWMYFRFVQATRPEVRDYFSYLNESYRSEAWTYFRLHLDGMRAACKADGVEFRVIVFPFMQKLGDEHPFRDAHKIIVDYCQPRGIPVLDLEPVMGEHAGENLTVNRFDAHPNEAAHAIAADAILEQLLSENPVSPGASP